MFYQLKKLIHKHNVSLSNIYNKDEKGFMLRQALKVKVICRKGHRNPYYTQDGKRKMVTIIECISADGVKAEVG